MLKDIKVYLEMQPLVLKVIRVIKDIRVVYQLMQFLQVVLSYGLVQQIKFRLVGYYVMVVTAHQT